jgi:serine/threonine-protein kinase
MIPQPSIAHYKILSELGEGGMGAVYRATDTKLNREVAIKVLPDAFANDPDRLARFTREAQVLAALNHPNIADIYGVEERALIMELVEGEDLHGPLPIETTLQYARQIADALEATHEKGIVHRDLKPANIKVTPQGVVKVLDFGLAAITQGFATATGDAANSPTLTMLATQAGMIMGTTAYMSPEQAAGKPVDRRADIWSFGVVLWEMLTGRRLFDGDTVSQVLAELLRAEIDVAALPTGTQPAVRALLRRCLDRNVRNRLRDIGEARVALESALQPSAEIAPPPARPAGKLPWIAAAAALIAAAVFGALYWRATRPVPRAMQRFDIPFTPVDPARMTFAISPDGTRLAYVARGQDGIQRLFTPRLDQAEGRFPQRNGGRDISVFLTRWVAGLQCGWRAQENPGEWLNGDPHLRRAGYALRLPQVGDDSLFEPRSNSGKLDALSLTSVANKLKELSGCKESSVPNSAFNGPG